MIGVIIVSHGKLSSKILEESRHIVGELENVVSVDFTAGERVADLERKLDQAYKEVKAEEGVLILVDMFGGSPSNVSMKLLKKYSDVEIITGFNLPIVVELISRDRYDSVQEFKEKLVKRGLESIQDLGKLIRQR